MMLTELHAEKSGLSLASRARTKLLAAIVACGLVLGMAGGAAGAGTALGSEKDSSATETAAASSASEQTQTEYPLEVTFYGLDGEETVTFDQAPEKVLVVGQGNIENMLALGLEDHIAGIAGVDSQVPEEYQEAFDSLNNLGVYCPDEEAMLEVDPDFIYAPKWLFMMNSMDLDEWFDRGVNVYINSNWNNNMEAPKSLENEYNDILTLGKIFNVQDRAEALVNQLKSQVSEIESRIEGQDSPSVMILFPDSDQLFANYSESDLAGNLAEELGATLAVNGPTSVGPEDIVNANPDVIIILYSSSYSQTEEDAAASAALEYFDNSAYANVTAVKEGHVYALSDGLMNIPGAGSARAMLELAQVLYPDVDFSDIEL
jgi:iron complex transport system substrate-binding protein